jgi:hypothetical protein
MARPTIAWVRQGLVLSQILHILRDVTVCFERSGGTTNARWSGRRGGCYCMMDARTGKIVLLVLLGEFAYEKRDKYMAFAAEKCARLYAHPEHWTSAESANDAAEQYAGAIRGRQYLHSFSGLPSEGDSLLSLLSAENLGDISKQNRQCVEARAGIVELRATFDAYMRKRF